METLKCIKEMCENHYCCDNCPLLDKDRHCLIADGFPDRWDLDKIEKALYGKEQDMDEYKKHVIDYVKKNVECVAYRDYIVEHLENENLYDAIENYKHEVTKEIEDGFIDEVEERTMMWCLDTLDKHISGKEKE